MEKPKPGQEPAPAGSVLTERLGPWLVYDPFVCAESYKDHLVKTGFKRKREAQAWLKKQIEKDDGAFAGCEVVRSSEVEYLWQA